MSPVQAASYDEGVNLANLRATRIAASLIWRRRCAGFIIVGMPKTRETALYGPIKQYFEDQGFVVRGEVNHCDLVAVRGQEVIVVEMKSTFNLTLVLQGIDRQQLGDAVYLAVERRRVQRPARRWRSIQRLCGQLGLGLMTVDLGRTPAVVEVAGEPQPSGQRRNRRKRRTVLGEFHQRSGDHNVGGSTRQPIVTAYREDALAIAGYLSTQQPASVAQIRAGTGIRRSGKILQHNHYGWFERIRHGTYTLTPAGLEALQAYAHVVHARVPGPAGGSV